jgi:hypothetical protein
VSIQPDVILTWPRHCDYPMWRAQLQCYRHRLGRIIVVFSEHHVGPDLRPWVRKQLEWADVEFLEVSRVGQDWRDVAVNDGLDAADADWVLFMEQDFFVTDHEFWDLVYDYASGGFAVGWRADGRWHPSFLLVKRSVVDLTSRYFGPAPVDHFYSFGREVSHLVPIAGLPESSFHHLAGLSQNHTLLYMGEYDDGIYRAADFEDYLRRCLDLANVSRAPEWEEQARAYLGRLKEERRG